MIESIDGQVLNPDKKVKPGINKDNIDELHQPKPINLNGYQEVLMGGQYSNGEFNTEITGYLYQDKNSPTTYHLLIQNNGNKLVKLDYSNDEYLFSSTDNKKYQPKVHLEDYPKAIEPHGVIRITLFLEDLSAQEINKLLVGFNNREVLLYFDKSMYLKK